MLCSLVFTSARLELELSKRCVRSPTVREGKVVMQFECGTRILRVIHGQDARATPSILRFPICICARPFSGSLSRKLQERQTFDDATVQEMFFDNLNNVCKANLGV